MLIAVELSKPPPEGAAPHVAGSNVQADFTDDSSNKKAKNGQTMWGNINVEIKYLDS